MRVSIKSFKSSPNTIDIYALAANGQRQELCRFIIPLDGDMVADVETITQIAKALQKRWKDIF